MNRNNETNSGSKLIEEIEKDLYSEYYGKYLSDIGIIVEEAADDVVSLSTRKFMDVINLERQKLRESFLNDVIFYAGKRFSKEDLSALAEIFDNHLSEIISLALTAMADAIKGYYKYRESQTMTSKFKERIEIVIKELARKEARLRVAEEMLKGCSEMEKENYMRDPMYRVLALLEEKGPMTATEVASEIRRSEATARRYLNKLISMQMVSKDTNQRPCVYKFVRAPWRRDL
ncbi:MAG: helix-turn-helix domain-containing protein [Candidatus Methanodesulfokora sp.]